jgi:uncharacterized phage protein (TIGR02218 family)
MADTRGTQAPVIAFATRDATEAARATQTAVVAFVQFPADGVRATQTPIVAFVKPLRAPCLTTDVILWRIERSDGVIYGFTSHDRSISHAGETYTPCDSLTLSALQLSAEIGATDNVDITGLISTARISESDLWAGKFDGAEVQLWRYAWGGERPPKLILSGQCGALQFDDTSYKFEIVTAAERLQQRPLLDVVTPLCRWKPGDARCTVDFAALAVTGTVTHVSEPNLLTQARRRIFRDNLRGEAAAFFTLGKLTWTSGDNSGLTIDVRQHSADGTFVLERPTQFPIETGDGYSVQPGDDQTLATCVAKFSNGVNFGGFPYVKGEDDLNRTPGSTS